MILKDYYRVDRDIASVKISQYLEVPPRHVEEALMRYGYIVVKRHEKQNPSFWFRITLPFFFVFGLIAIVSIPIKYIMTGEYAYTENRGIGKIYKNWSKKLGF